jgi:trimeric autotransporter adhesin
MVQILRHELKKQGNETVLFLYLDQSNTEFARELGSLDDNTKGDLNKSVNSYIRNKLPNLKAATVKIMVGGLLVTSFAFSPAVGGLFGGDDNRAHAAEVEYKGFADVKPDRESAPAIEALVKAGVIKGYPDGFHPREEISRQHAAVMFVRALKLPTDNVTDPGFKDVPTTHPYYKEIAAATAAGYFNKADTFNPNGNFTRGQSASVIVRAYDLEGEKTSPFTDLTGSGHEDAIGIMYNLGLAKGVGNAYKPNDNVTREQFAMLLHRTIEAQDVAGVVATVRSVNVTDTNKVEVGFSSAIKDTSKVTAQLKKGLATQYTTANWSPDKKSVVLEAPADIPAGDYEVVVSGLGNEDVREAVKIEAETAKSVELLNTSVAKVDGAKVSFKVLNQYGTDMEVLANSEDLTFSVYNVTQGKDLTLTKAPTATKNEFNLNLADDANAKINDKIRVISTYKGINATKELTVVAASAIADIDLGSATLPQDATRFSVNTSGVKLPYTLKDQYGNDKKLAANQKGATFDGITFLSSNPDIVDAKSFATDANGALTFDIGKTAGTVTLTTIINATGDVSTTTLKVEDVAQANAVSISSPTKLIAANETVDLDLVVTNQFGDVIKNTDAAVQNLKVSTDAKAASATIVNGKLQVVAGATAGSTTVTIKDADNVKELGRVTFNIEAAAEPTVITGVTTPTLFEQGATRAISFDDIQVKDQYGRDYKLKAGDSVSVAHKDTTADNVTFAISGNNNGSLEAGETVTFTGTTSTNNEDVTFGLNNGAKFNVTLASVASKDISSYEVKSVPTIFAQGTTGATKYNYDLELVGKVNGKDVALAANKITHATSSNPAVATVDVAGGKATLTGLTKGTTTVSVWSGGTKLADSTVTVSDAAPTATTVKFNKAINLKPGGTAVDAKALLEVLDQYGVDVAKDGYWAISSDVATVDNGTVTPHATKTGEATLTYVTKNGIAASTTVEVR